jgi:predicted nuclease of predicted toxin-antitoxin system
LLSIVKLLLDSCLSHRLAEELRVAGHDVIAAAEWPKDPGDPQILATAHDQHRILVTLDVDFGELAIVKGQIHFGIIRIDGPRAHEYAGVCIEALAKYAEDLDAGGIVVIEVGRMRLRPGRPGA